MGECWAQADWGLAKIEPGVDSLVLALPRPVLVLRILRILPLPVRLALVLKWLVGAGLWLARQGQRVESG